MTSHASLVVLLKVVFKKNKVEEIDVCEFSDLMTFQSGEVLQAGPLVSWPCHMVSVSKHTSVPLPLLIVPGAGSPV